MLYRGEARVMIYSIFDSPIGPLLIAGDEEALRYIFFPKNGKAAKPERGWIESPNRCEWRRL